MDTVLDLRVFLLPQENWEMMDGVGELCLATYNRPSLINNVLQAVAHCPISVLFGSIDIKMCFKLKTNVTETIKSAFVFFSLVNWCLFVKHV